MAGAMMSGPKVSSFREGWALAMMTWGKAHYRRGEAGVARPLCGGQTRAAGWLMEEGNWERCKRCERALANRPHSPKTVSG